MKYLILIASLIFINCKAQTPILSLYDVNTGYGDVPNAYYKDVDNFRGQFVGTWLYTNGTTSIKVVFEKRDMIYRNSPIPFYFDKLVGEIRYVEAGIEKLNTLSNLGISYPDNVWKYNLVSMSQFENNVLPFCSICPTNVTGLKMWYNEPDNDDVCLTAYFTMYHVVEGGVDKLKVKYYLQNAACGVNEENWDNPSTKTEFIVPHGEYTFIKQ